ncbi:MAG TPA: hypothetical protein VFA77_15220 [Candidatus Eisenbacteria bacterium]|jgi:hypothetical protein|nr:hypothetical protein [Candidatus Eisenbacteria bacterium]
MNFEPDKHLERLIQEELTKLPELRAPATLIPRVNSRIRAHASVAWGRTPWLAWPVRMKVISFLLFAALLGVVAANLNEIQLAVYAEKIRLGTVWLGEIWHSVTSLLNAGLVVSRALSEHFLIWTLLLFGLMAVVIVGVGSGLWRLAFADQLKG